MRREQAARCSADELVQTALGSQEIRSLRTVTGIHVALTNRHSYEAITWMAMSLDDPSKSPEEYGATNLRSESCSCYGSSEEAASLAYGSLGTM